MTRIYTYIVLALFSLLLMHAANAVSYEQNYSNPISTATNSNADFAIRTLKYEPYPVNPGEWFDIWVQVENLGEQDASDVSFQVEPTYPFKELAHQEQTFTTVSGSANAFLGKLPGENETQANKVLLKYKVGVDPSATEGTYNLRLHMSYKPTTSQATPTEKIKEIPIVVQKTKTSFTAVMQDSNPQRTTFTIANVGEKPATGVTVSVGEDAQALVQGSSTAIIGNLDAGDFTTVSFQLHGDAQSVPLQVSYTDTSGIRSTVNETVPVNLAAAQPPATPDTTKRILGINAVWVYAFIALIAGIIVGAVISRKAGK